MKDGLIFNMGMLVPMMFMFTDSESDRKKTKRKNTSADEIKRKNVSHKVIK